MGFHNIEDINRVITKIHFVKIIDEFSKDGDIIRGKVLLQHIEGLNNNLEFEVVIYPQYPFKHNESETIKFVNKDLVHYNHVMKNGEICIHTLHSSKLKQKLIADFESLRAWVEKYYINKENDSHYEHIVIEEQPFEGVYYSYQFTDVEYFFTKGEFGVINLIPFSTGIYKGKGILNSLVKSFLPYTKGISIDSKWNNFYMNLEAKHYGLFLFLGDVPALYNRFAFSNWLEFKNCIPKEFLDLLNKHRLKSKKNKSTLLPIFFGYNIPNGKIHWISAIVKLNDMPIKAVPVKNDKGIKIKGKWEGQLLNKKITWAITRNSSYEYLFGRGTFCDKITNAKILIIGVGAIGSIVAKTLVKCGAKNINLVDYDLKEPENICRSEYEFINGFCDKTDELVKILNETSPFVKVKYANEEYFSYIKALYKLRKVKSNYENFLNNYDIVFNCSADSDLMYVLDDLELNTDLINLSITNHAKDLVCAFYPNIYRFVQTQFISILDNDVDDLYNPTGCWSPTFKASYNDINLLVQYALKQINFIYQENKPKNNFTLSTTFENNLEIKLTRY
ncbi:ThiF family adenylyltransferase [Ornithobacterium rhinotracheale]